MRSRVTDHHSPNSSSPTSKTTISRVKSHLGLARQVCICSKVKMLTRSPASTCLGDAWGSERRLGAGRGVGARVGVPVRGRLLLELLPIGGHVDRDEVGQVVALAPHARRPVGRAGAAVGAVYGHRRAAVGQPRARLVVPVAALERCVAVARRQLGARLLGIVGIRPGPDTGEIRARLRAWSISAWLGLRPTIASSRASSSCGEIAGDRGACAATGGRSRFWGMGWAWGGGRGGGTWRAAVVLGWPTQESSGLRPGERARSMSTGSLRLATSTVTSS